MFGGGIEYNGPAQGVQKEPGDCSGGGKIEVNRIEPAREADGKNPQRECGKESEAGDDEQVTEVGHSGLVCHKLFLSVLSKKRTAISIAIIATATITAIHLNFTLLISSICSVSVCIIDTCSCTFVETFGT